MNNGMANELINFSEDIIKKLVDNPDDINVDCVISTKSVIIQIKANINDYGKIIGKQGKTIESLKILTTAIKNTKFSKDARKIYIEVLEDEDRNFTKK